MKQKFFNLILSLALIFITASPLWANNIMLNTYWNDFSQGISDFLHFSNPTDLYNLEDQNGTLHITKNADSMNNVFRSAQIRTRFPVSGDFDVRINYQLIEPLQNGDQLELQVYGESFYFFAVRSNESGLGGQNVHVFYGEDMGAIAPNPCIAFSAMEGTLRVTRSGEMLTAYAKSKDSNNYQMIYSHNFPAFEEVYFKLSLQSQDYSHGSQDVHLDDFRIMGQMLNVLENDTRPLFISDGSPPYSIVHFDSQIIGINIQNDIIYVSGVQQGFANLTVKDTNEQTQQIMVQVIPPARIWGDFRDKENQPVPNVRVQIESLHTDAQLFTKADGSFEINNLYPGQVEITVIPDPSTSLLPVFETYMLTQGEHRYFNNNQLKSGTKVVGRLKKPNNEPFPNATLFIPSLGPAFAVNSSENGDFMLCLPEGEWYLDVRPENEMGLFPFSIHVQNQELIQLGDVLTYAYSVENRISGLVMGDISPWDSLQVVAFPSGLDINPGNVKYIAPFASGDLNNDNTYELFSPAGESIQLFLVSNLDEPDMETSITILEHHPDVQAPKNNENFSFTSGGYSIQSHVYWNDNPVSNCRAALINTQTNQMIAFADTNKNGQLDFHHIFASNYEIRVETEMYTGNSEPFSVTDHGTVPDVHLTATEISGKILGVDNIGVSNIHGEVFRKNCWNEKVADFQSDENGNFSVQVPPGQYFLVVHPTPHTEPRYTQLWWSVNGGASDCQEASPVNVPEGSAAQNINFQLIPGVLIKGQVKSITGEPLSRVCINALIQACDGRSVCGTQTQDDGTYELIIPTGNYAIQTSTGCDQQNSHYTDQFWDHADTCQQAVYIQSTEGQNLENINFELKVGIQVHGRVVDTEHKPIENLKVGIWHEGAHIWRETKTDDQGEYILKGFPDGTAFIEIDSDFENSRVGFRSRILIAGPQNHEVPEIVIQYGFAVTGKLVHPNNTPVGNTQLECFADNQFNDMDSDENGNFSIILSDGSWTLFLDDDELDVGLIPVTFSVQGSAVNLGDVVVFDHTPDNRISGSIDLSFNPKGNLEVVLFPSTTDFSPKNFYYIHPMDYSEPNELGQFELNSPNDMESTLILISMIDEDENDAESGTVFQIINGIQSPQSNVTFQWHEEGYTLSASLQLYNGKISGNENAILYRIEDENPIFIGFSQIDNNMCFQMFNVPSGTYKLAVSLPDYQIIEQTEPFNLDSSLQLPPIVIYGNENLKGDINGNACLDLADALIGLRLAANLNVNQAVFLEADINNDNAIGIHESIFVLRKISE
ncbi:conserved hypothetical protein, secreted [Candidatus Magnetomorum sp. HK-1]|nr:conserved hypothetical protein, secreted [Candidatus Magnetomorum sp. HK-1]